MSGSRAASALRVTRGNSLPAVPLPTDVNKNPAALLTEAHGLLASPDVLNPNPGLPVQILCPGLGPPPSLGAWVSLYTAVPFKILQT